MGAKFKSGFKPEERVSKLMAVYAKRAEKAARFLVTRMVADTNRGIDIDGQAFEGYSSAYKEYRSDAGYQINPPNLTITGQMLGAMTSEVSQVGKDKVKGKIYFRRQNTAYSGKRSHSNNLQTKIVSTVDKARYNLKTRKFFGMSQRHLQFFLNYLRGKNAR